MSERAWIALGSNLGFPAGDRRGAISWAVDTLDRRSDIDVVELSTIRETVAVGPVPQPRFLNAVVELAVDLEPATLLGVCLAIESVAGRDRRHEVRWGPRSLDLDLVMFGDRVVEVPGLSLPHPRMAERRFVLEPLAELAPDLVHPLLGRSIRCLLDSLPIVEPE